MKHRSVVEPLVGLGAMLALITACEPGTREPEPTSAEQTARNYHVRGVLQALPDPATGTGELYIRHEAVPDLVGPGGEVESMAPMTMPFPVDAEVDLTDLALGDIVQFELRVDWQAARPVAVTAIEKLPAGVELVLD